MNVGFNEYVKIIQFIKKTDRFMASKKRNTFKPAS